MEQVLILGLGLGGQLAAATAVVAAKSIIRFPEINAQKARDNGNIGIDDVTEYFPSAASPAGSSRSKGWRWDCSPVGFGEPHRRTARLPTLTPLKMNAAVPWGINEKWSVEVELNGPQEGEVLVSFEATGLCHSDPRPIRRSCRGAPTDHRRTRGRGIVQEVGPGVRDLKVGDHVVASFLPACGRCRWCATGHQVTCVTWVR